jgi:hypothetical protein
MPSQNKINALLKIRAKSVTHSDEERTGQNGSLCDGCRCAGLKIVSVEQGFGIIIIIMNISC